MIWKTEGIETDAGKSSPVSMVSRVTGRTGFEMKLPVPISQLGFVHGNGDSVDGGDGDGGVDGDEDYDGDGGDGGAGLSLSST